MYVIKRDGTREEVKIEKILTAVNRACRGIENVESIEIAKRTISGLHDGSTTQELDRLSIANAVMLMSEEPNYSKVAARMLSESILKEVGRDSAFRDCIRIASECGMIADRVLELVQEQFEVIEYAIHHERDDYFEYFGLKTLADRYLLRHPETRKIIERPQWMLMRVSLGLANNVQEAIDFYNLISQFYYLPATPTLFNSGTRHPQMSSCYLLTVGDDSLSGIYKSITDSAMLSKFSGGIGIDWTSVRASGALIKSTNGMSNGVIPFLKVFDSSVHAVNQGGRRKGAAAVYLENWHSDIEAFLELRNNTGTEQRRTHNLNLAIWISDLFMQRVEANEDWSLFTPNQVPMLLKTYGKEFDAWYQRYEQEGLALKTISARDLYARMTQTLAETGNGWFCFKDKSNLRCAQTGKSEHMVHSSNLCTEILEVTSAGETAVCNLGSINLSRLVGPKGFDFEKLQQVVELAVTFLDRVVDINFYPTQEAAVSNQKWRPVGLGIMGLQDAFFKLRLPFTSAQAKQLSNRISEEIYYHALKTSMKLAQELGRFEGFEQSRYAEGKLQVQLAQDCGQALPELHHDWDRLALEVQQNGLRNSLLIAIAPTATIASILGSFESIEPQISNFFKRETLSGEFLQVNRYLIADLKALNLWTDALRSKIIAAEGSIQNISEVPEDLKALYRTVWEIPQKELIDMAVARSTFICQSQSLNLFMENPSLAKLSSMYMYAWKQGVKTTYYLRSRAKTSIQKTTIQVEDQQALACSLENPETCEVCQ
ncbi:MAG: ribonucleoside-diphosphate reductase subunit alpha [Myxococcaceae bacterium]|nr:ribonucleoside-diphosphate reductase subunit alpha [Myxococcaceae bacterium]MBH2006530.1 ribonucleoside-diphosphate reductase subunit alpha [Myxococcaceae bacterium]